MSEVAGRTGSALAWADVIVEVLALLLEDQARHPESYRKGAVHDGLVMDMLPELVEAYRQARWSGGHTADGERP